MLESFKLFLYVYLFCAFFLLLLLRQTTCVCYSNPFVFTDKKTIRMEWMNERMNEQRVQIIKITLKLVKKHKIDNFSFLPNVRTHLVIYVRKYETFHICTISSQSTNCPVESCSFWKWELKFFENTFRSLMKNWMEVETVY